MGNRKIAVAVTFPILTTCCWLLACLYKFTNKFIMSAERRHIREAARNLMVVASANHSLPCSHHLVTSVSWATWIQCATSYLIENTLYCYSPIYAQVKPFLYMCRLKFCMKMAVFRVAAPCSLAEIGRRFGGCNCLHQEPWWWKEHELLIFYSISMRLHGAISQKTDILISSAVRT